MNEFTRPVEKISKSAADYVDLKISDLKLRTVKGLSVSLNYVLSMILILFVVNLVLTALAAGFIFLLGSAIGNYAVGAFIVALIFAVIAFILYKNRNRLFVNGFVQTFIKLFFDDDEEDEDVNATEIINDIDIHHE